MIDLPTKDAANVTQEQIQKIVRLAPQARDRAPWKDEVPDEVFLNYVLPYCVVTERREEWRENFFNRFLALVKGECALVKLNAITQVGVSGAFGQQLEHRHRLELSLHTHQIELAEKKLVAHLLCC